MTAPLVWVLVLVGECTAFHRPREKAVMAWLVASPRHSGGARWQRPAVPRLVRRELPRDRC